MKTIIAISASALLALALAVSLGAEGPDAEAVERGRAQAEQNCGRCHPGAQRDALVRRKVGGGDPGEVLEGFLPKHHAPDAALREDLIAYLRHQLAQPPGN